MPRGAGPHIAFHDLCRLHQFHHLVFHASLSETPFPDVAALDIMADADPSILAKTHSNLQKFYFDILIEGISRANIAQEAIENGIGR